jgi:hypothetical protein
MKKFNNYPMTYRDFYIELYKYNDAFLLEDLFKKSSAVSFFYHITCGFIIDKCPAMKIRTVSLQIKFYISRWAISAKSPLTFQLSRSRSYFRLTVSQSVSMSWYRVPLCGLRPDITSCQNVTVRNLRSCIYWAPSLTRGRVCNLQCNRSIVRVAQNP